MIGIGLGLSKNNSSGGGAPAVSYILDDYAGATYAYSLRKLKEAYAGSAIRVRRDSDNAEQDIGFTAEGILNVSAMETFVGANNGFVTTWYDQVGSQNAVNATAAQQPYAIISGTSVVSGLNPAIQFGIGASSRGHLTASGASRTQPHTQTLAFETYTGTATYFLMDNLSGTGRCGMFMTNPTQLQLYAGATLQNVLDATMTSGDPAIVTGIYNGASSLEAMNSFTATGNAGTDNPSGLDLGLSTGNSPSRKIMEAVFFDSDYSATRAAFETAMNTHYSIY